MINLIPPEGHRTVKREYFLRVSASLMFLLGVVFSLLTVAFVPMYVLVDAQIEASQDEEEKASDGEDIFKKMEGEVLITKQILAQLSTATPSVFASTLIDEIQSIAPQDIEFKTFSAEDRDGIITQIQIQGSASTRGSLAHLKTALEASDLFLTAEVPIADLARDVDLPFTIRIKLASSTPTR